MAHWTAPFFKLALSALSRRAEGSSGMGSALRSVGRYPLRAVMAFLAAPFLAFRVARYAKSPLRRLVAGTGLFLSLLAAWFAGTFVGSITAAVLVGAKFGALWGIALLVGMSLSVVLSVSFSLVVFNAVALFFLHASS